MNVFGEGNYRRVVASSQIAGADKYELSYFQVQIVVTNNDGGEITHTPVIYDQVMLQSCGQAPPTRPTFAPAPTAIPTQTPIPPPG